MQEPDDVRADDGIPEIAEAPARTRQYRFGGLRGGPSATGPVGVDSSHAGVAIEHGPCAVLLYERDLGRPFASHRDPVSELVGDVMEGAIEERPHRARITTRKSRRAERIPDFERAPDFLISTACDPAVVIEATITSDDGTARGKRSVPSACCGGGTKRSRRRFVWCNCVVAASARSSWHDQSTCSPGSAVAVRLATRERHR